MTTLKKRLRRDTGIPADHHGRSIIIELDPGPPAVFRFREKGRRSSIECLINWVYFQAVKRDAEVKAREKQKQKQLKKRRI
jgi:hypothetical protein